MAEQVPGADEEMMEWDGGDQTVAQELDREFREGDCVELEMDSDAPDLSDEDIDDEDVVEPDDDLDEDDEFAGIDNSLATVHHKESVLSVAISPADSTSVVTGGQDDAAVLWKLEEEPTGLKCTQRIRLEGHTDSVNQVSFSHDGQYVATGSYDATVKIWNAASGALVHSLEGPAKELEWVIWHPKGHAILAGSNDTMAWMWWAPTGKLMQIFAGHAQGVTCGCWALAGKQICTGSEDCSVIVWNPRAGTPQQHIKSLHDSNIIAICSHPEAPIIVTGSEDATSKVVHIETGKVLATLGGHTESVECVRFSNPTAGGMLLLATGSMDGKIQIWDGKTYEIRCTLKDHVDRGGIVAFKWLPAPTYGSWLCTCSTDRTLRIYNALSAECIQTLCGHTDTVLDLDVVLVNATDGSSGQQLCVVSGSDDNSCRVFVAPLHKSAGPPTAAQSTAPSSQSTVPAANSGLDSAKVELSKSSIVAPTELSPTSSPAA